jgi:hypothetical protein
MDSKELWEDFRKYEHRILDRCCRATLLGAVEISEIEDPVLMNRYRPSLKYCPECGKEL